MWVTSVTQMILSCTCTRRVLRSFAMKLCMTITWSGLRMCRIQSRIWWLLAIMRANVILQPVWCRLKSRKACEISVRTMPVGPCRRWSLAASPTCGIRSTSALSILWLSTPKLISPMRQKRTMAMAAKSGSGRARGRQCAAQIIGLKAGHFAPNGAYRAWLNTDLQEASENRAQRPWIVAFGHRPWVFQNGTSRDHAVEAAHSDLFQKYGVDLYLAGHVV
mmetsp:Transcript_88301/g.201920  ORF Transcript_88301/g.201920 Transcript_88301/m.201920 type:complete len:220 (+) Transcript_88301:705-1364(+)